MPLDTGNLSFQPEFETFAQWNQRLTSATAPQSGTIEDIYTRFMLGQATETETRIALDQYITSKGGIQPKPGLGSFSPAAGGTLDIIAEWKAQKMSGPPQTPPGNDFPGGPGGAGMTPEQEAALMAELAQAQQGGGGGAMQPGQGAGPGGGGYVTPPPPGTWGAALLPYYQAGAVSLEEFKQSFITPFMSQGLSAQDAAQAADQWIQEHTGGGSTPGYEYPAPPVAPPQSPPTSGGGTIEHDPWVQATLQDQATQHRQAVSETPQYAWDRYVLSQWGKGGVAPPIQASLANRGSILEGLAPLYGVGGAPGVTGEQGGPSFADYFRNQGVGYPASADTQGRLRRLAGAAYALPGQEMTLEDQQFLSPFLGKEGGVNQESVNNAFLSAMLAGVAPEARSGTRGLYNRLYSQQQIQEPETPWLQYAQKRGYF